MHKKTLDEFWSQIRIAAPNECWEWTGYLDPKGYGRTKYHGRLWFAHRLAYTLVKGEIPQDQFACHSCDNPRCCNPDHIWPGTNAENTKDRHQKGRDARGLSNGANTQPELHPRGEQHGMAKLSDAQVAEIRDLYETGNFMKRTLARRFGVSDSQIGNILARRNR